MAREALCALFLVLGSLFMLTASLGVLRMPDIFMRMSASTKATTLGLSTLLVAALISFGEVGVQGRILAILVFLVLTSPVAAHAIARAAYLSGAKLWGGTSVDQLRNCYDLHTHRLAGKPETQTAKATKNDKPGGGRPTDEKPRAEG